MAAYAALVSLMHIIEQIQHHPRPPISLDEEQVKSLGKKITFLQDFLESYSHDKSCKGTESHIAEAAYAAEDVIESRIVDQILDGSTDHVVEISSSELHKDLHKVIQEMEFIIIEVVEIKRKRGIHDMLQQNPRSIPDELHRDSLVFGGSNSSRSSSMVGNEDVLNDIMEKLIRQQSNRQIIPIFGMGGIGKTTLAMSIYVNPLIVQHFDVLGWVAISQEYRVRDILVEVLLCLKNNSSKESLGEMTENELGEKLYKYLSGRRYLVIIDDIWSTEAWDKMKFFFPDYNNQSRIIVTTRLSQVAFQLTNSYRVDVNFLDEGYSWNLLFKTVFGEEIVVIGGLLGKSKRTQEYWEYIAENINTIVNLEDNECCLKILCTSYDELPVYLKPCFLYMGVFPEDDEIRVSLLIKLWVAEGFLKPISGKNLEVVAEEYLKDLIDINLILVHKLGFGAKLKSCGIHDLLRDLCLREAQETKFLCVTRHHSINIPQGIKTQRRVAIHQSSPKKIYLPQVVSLRSVPSLTRSLICDAPQDIPSLNLRLLKVLKADDRALHSGDLHPIEGTFQLVNSRYIAFGVDWFRISNYLSSISLFWNLQMLIVYGTWDTGAPIEIWKMRQLKHVKFDLLYLPDPPPSGHETEGQDGLIVLENLQSLSQI
ncbi:hypothetical protein ACS0TY_006787 [Phlomoides rotata]